MESRAGRMLLCMIVISATRTSGKEPDPWWQNSFDKDWKELTDGGAANWTSDQWREFWTPGVRMWWNG